MNLSLTTKWNCLHLLEAFKVNYNNGECGDWDEYDLDYLISLVKQDLGIS